MSVLVPLCAVSIHQLDCCTKRVRNQMTGSREHVLKHFLVISAQLPKHQAARNPLSPSMFSPELQPKDVGSARRENFCGYLPEFGPRYGNHFWAHRIRNVTIEQAV